MKSQVHLDPLRDVQQDPPRGTCARCDGEVYAEELMFQWEGNMICSDCFRSAVTKLLRDNPRQIALEMGLEVERVS